MMHGWSYLSPSDETSLASHIVRGTAPRGPSHLELQPTNLCCTSCFFCSSRASRHGESLPFDLLERAIREAVRANLRSLRLSGGGESLMFPHIRRLIALAAELGLRFDDVTTNGLHLARCADLLLAAGTDHLNVSLNEPTAERYAASMGVGPRVFDQVIAGIRVFQAGRTAAPGRHRPKVTVKFLLWRDNYHLLPQMVQLARELEVDSVLISTIHALPDRLRMSQELAPAIELIGHIVGTNHDRFVAFHLGDEPGLRFVPTASPSSPDLPDDAPPRGLNEYCYIGWHSATIAADGQVFPCCNFVGDQARALGSLHQQSLLDIWQGARFREFRSEFRDVALRGPWYPFEAALYSYCTEYCTSRACPFARQLAPAEFYHRTTPALRQRHLGLTRMLARWGRKRTLRKAIR